MPPASPPPPTSRSTTRAPPTSSTVTVDAPPLRRGRSTTVLVSAHWVDTEGRRSAPSDELTLTVWDPRPPAAVVVDPTLRYAARPDVTGLARVELTWSAASPQDRFRVYYADETTLARSTRRLTRHRGLFAALDGAAGPVERGAAWTDHAAGCRETPSPSSRRSRSSGSGPEMRLEHALPGSLRTLALYRIVAVSERQRRRRLHRVAGRARRRAQHPAAVATAPGRAGARSRPRPARTGATAELTVTVPRGSRRAVEYRLRRSRVSSADPLLMPIVATGTLHPPDDSAAPHVEVVIDAGPTTLEPDGVLAAWTTYTWRIEVRGGPESGGGPPTEWSQPSQPVGASVVPLAGPPSPTIGRHAARRERGARRRRRAGRTARRIARQLPRRALPTASRRARAARRHDGRTAAPRRRRAVAAGRRHLRLVAAGRHHLSRRDRRPTRSSIVAQHDEEALTMVVLNPTPDALDLESPALGPWFDDTGITLAVPDADLAVSVTPTTDLVAFPPATGLLGIRRRHRTHDRGCSPACAAPMERPPSPTASWWRSSRCRPRSSNASVSLAQSIVSANGNAAVAGVPSRPTVRHLAYEFTADTADISLLEAVVAPPITDTAPTATTAADKAAHVGLGVADDGAHARQRRPPDERPVRGRGVVRPAIADAHDRRPATSRCGRSTIAAGRSTPGRSRRGGTTWPRRCSPTCGRPGRPTTQRTVAFDPQLTVHLVNAAEGALDQTLLGRVTPRR